MKPLFENSLLQTAERLFEGIDRVLLAVSGGADSVAMVHALHRLRQQGDLSCDFVIGHVNHCLRGTESDADEAFVRQMGQSLGLGVVSQKVDVNNYAKANKLSLETAGRVLRLKMLSQMADEYECCCIATAHHKDDLAETMIHRLMRGTGFRGLCGIWPVSEVYGGEFVRPMLGLRRDEVIRYCRDHSFPWRQDASNENVNFTRNHIRHRLLPVLEDESDGIVDKLENLSLKSRRFQLFTEKLARSIVDRGEHIPEAGQFSLKQGFLEEITPWISYEVVREILVKMGVGLRRYKREHFEMIQRLVGKKRSSIVLPNGVVVWALGDTLKFLYHGQKLSQIPTMPDEMVIPLEIGGTVCFGPWQISSVLLNRADVDVDSFMRSKDTFVEWFDADTVVGSVEIRGRRDGDRFWPIGASGEKKVARFLIDAQLEAEAKQQAVIIKDTEKILWVAPVRMCERARITKKTRKILEIRVESRPD